ncbi:MAG: oligosaccharide flippase family protein [Chloroflexi bacterium]|nr:oligosaccharide flippase family protein [Chloroflexota bacterium]
MAAEDVSYSSTIAPQAIRGSVLISTAVGINGLIGFAANIVFNRHLGPLLIGEYAFALAISDLLGLLISIGLDIYLVQAENCSRELFHSALTLGSLLGLAFIALSAAIGGFFWFHGEHILAGLIVGLGVQRLVLINTASYFALLRRDLRFQALSFIQILTGILEHGIAVSIALLGGGVWSLFTRDMLDAILNLAFAIWVTRVRFAFAWRISEIRRMVRFGGAILVSQSGELAVHHIDSALLGIVSGRQELAFYDEAFKIGDISRRVASPALQQVALPTYSQLRHEPDSQQLAFGRVQAIGGILLVPFALTLFLYPFPVIVTLFGPNWAGAAPILRIFAGYILLQPALDHVVQLLLSQGKAVSVARAKVAQLLFFLPLLFILLPHFQGVGAAAAVVGALLASLLYALWEARSYTGSFIHWVHRSAAAAAVFLLFAAIATLLTTGHSIILTISVLLALYGSVVITAVFIFPAGRQLIIRVVLPHR